MTAKPRSPASWSIQTAVSLARIAIQEIDPDRLKGYGPLGAAAADTIRRLNADLDRGIRGLQSHLERTLDRRGREG